jgi:hypothetical protein
MAPRECGGVFDKHERAIPSQVIARLDKAAHELRRVARTHNYPFAPCGLGIFPLHWIATGDKRLHPIAVTL